LAEVSGLSITPRRDLAAIKIPDATPEIISGYALGDEQALLAKVRYNRLIDIFLGITTYSLQNHLRTYVAAMGQIEIDEIYVGLNRQGAHFVIPVQAKGGADKLSPVQTRQDIECCKAKFPNLVCRPVSAQFMADDVIALFELTSEGDQILVLKSVIIGSYQARTSMLMRSADMPIGLSPWRAERQAAEICMMAKAQIQYGVRFGG
jgi:hypothetical protein